MADRARDLTFNVLSKADRFDLTRPARELDDLADTARDTGRGLSDVADDATGAARDLERVGDAARESGRDLERAGDDARDTGRRLEEVGDDARDAARRYDQAADAIASASRRAASDVDRAGDKAGESLRDMGEEGQDTAREMAASFDGTADGIQDAMQEAATNVLATLGPIGAAVGVAGGVAIGWLRGQAEQLREQVSGIVSELLDAGQGSRGQLITDQLRKLAEEGRILDLANQARTAKVDVSDYLRAVAGDPDAIERTRHALSKYDTTVGNLDPTFRAGVLTAEAMHGEMNRSEQVWTLAADAAAAYADALPPGVAAQEAFTDAVGEFSDMAGTYSDVLAAKEEKERETAQATADATESQTDSWEDYAKDVKVSVREYLDALEEQVTAQEEWADNLETLAKKGVEEGVLAELARMGPEGAPLVAALTKASDAELRELVQLYTRRGKQSGQGLADEVRDSAPLAEDAVSGVMAAMIRQASGGVTVPLKVGNVSRADLNAAIWAAQAVAPPIVVPILSAARVVARELP